MFIDSLTGCVLLEQDDDVEATFGSDPASIDDDPAEDDEFETLEVDGVSLVVKALNLNGRSAVVVVVQLYPNISGKALRRPIRPVLKNSL